MPQHKDQRVGVFVDVQNLYYSAKQFYHSKVNFAHILKKAVGNRQLVRAIAYVIKADIKEEGNFFDALEKIGYDVRSKDLQTFYTGAKKGDWDVGIAMDIMRMAAKLDVIVLCSGDGDFKDLLEHVKALGCRAEVIAFGKTSSSRILSETDDFYDLGKELDKSLIKDFSKQDNNKQEALPEAIEGEEKPSMPMQPRPAMAPRPMQPRPGVAPRPMQQRQGVAPRPQFADNGKREFPRKEFVKKEFKPFERSNDRGRGFQKPDFQREDEASFIQRINMDQPLPEPKVENKQERRFERPNFNNNRQQPPVRPPFKPMQQGQPRPPFTPQKAQPPAIGKEPFRPMDMPKVSQQASVKKEAEKKEQKQPEKKKEETKAKKPEEKKAEKDKKPKAKKPKA